LGWLELSTSLPSALTSLLDSNAIPTLLDFKSRYIWNEKEDSVLLIPSESSSGIRVTSVHFIGLAMNDNTIPLKTRIYVNTEKISSFKAQSIFNL